MAKFTRHFLFSSFAVIIALAGLSFRKVHSGGEIGATGSPGEGTCGGCHGGGPAGTSISITAVPAFSNNNYIPGQLYTITINVNHATQPAFGFDCEILNSSNANAGTMQNPGTGVQLFNFGSKRNATHTTPKSGSGTAAFTFLWLAPNSGTATIYVSGNAVNLSSSTSGDSPANTNKVLTPDPLASLKENQEVEISGVSFYPNPASEILSLSYYLRSDKAVVIELIQLDGKLVKEVFNQNEKAGPNSHILDLKSVDKGVYFMKISSEGETLAQKLLLLR
jgi:hypothetical protein